MRFGPLASSLGIGLAVGTSVQAADPATVVPHALLAMTPQDFETSASVKDDALEVTATITTQPGYQEKHGLLRIVWSDNFLRAFVDKQSGAASYQLYQKIVYAGRLYKYFDTINYETPAGRKSVGVIDLGRSKDCSRSNLIGGCVRTESVVVPIAASLLGTIAGRYAPAADAGWRFRFKAQSGDDYDGFMVPAEVAGVLAAVADYRRAHGVATPGA